MNARSYSRISLVAAYVILVLNMDAGSAMGWYLVALGVASGACLTWDALKMAREHAAETMRGGA